jgi:hypothetical protein
MKFRSVSKPVRLGGDEDGLIPAAAQNVASGGSTAGGANVGSGADLSADVNKADRMSALLDRVAECTNEKCIEAITAELNAE